MPCNSGVSLIPIVNGKEDQFAARGLYNGLALLADYTTNSYWDHITGECVHGNLKGQQLEFTDFDLIYTSVAGALAMNANVQIAFSPQLSLHGKFMKFIMAPFMHRILGNRLPPHFERTLGKEDTRRERMDLGLGIWTGQVHRYYPLTLLQNHPTGIIDEINGQILFVYYNQVAKAPDAVYVDAQQVQIEGDTYCFDTGYALKNGRLLDPSGHEIRAKRPQQMFTRWYGFAYTFPNCEIYGES